MFVTELSTRASLDGRETARITVKAQRMNSPTSLVVPRTQVSFPKFLVIPMRKAQSKRTSKKVGMLTTAADTAEELVRGVPGFKELLPAVRGIRKILGFNERAVYPTGSAMPEGGGTLVQTMAAPVAFQRGALKTGLQSVHKSQDSEIFWCCDLASTVTLPASSTFSAGTIQIVPSHSALFPNFFTSFEDWERWRPLLIRLHYGHFAPTSSQAAVSMAVTEDANATELAADDSSTAAVTAIQDSAMGACYEDFSLVAVPEPWKQGEWLYNDTADGADPRLNSAGAVIIATDVNVPVSVGVGYLYIELLFEVTGRRKPYVGAGLYNRLVRSSAGIPEQELDRFVTWAMSQVEREFRTELRRRSKPKPAGLLEEFRSAAVSSQKLPSVRMSGAATKI